MPLVETHLAESPRKPHVRATVVVRGCLIVDVLIGRFGDADRAKFDEPDVFKFKFKKFYEEIIK